MKRTLLVFLALALVSSFAFAEAVVGGEASISGSVSLTTGYDLDTNGFGFVNDSDIQIVLPILAGDAGASGNDGVYAEIKVENLNWQWDVDNGGLYDVDNDASGSSNLDADISATIHFNSLYLGLGNPDFSFNYADIGEGDYPIDANADAFDTNGGGFSLGFMNDMMDVSLMVASEKDAYLDTAQDGDATAVADVDEAALWTNQDDGVDGDHYLPNSGGNMIYGVKAMLTPADGVSVAAKFLYDAKSGAATDDLMAFGGKASVAMGAFTLDVPVDYVAYGSTTGLELMPSVAYAVMEGFDVNASVLYGTYEKLAPVNPVMDVTVGLADTEAFVPGLNWTLDVTLSNFMDYTDAGLDILPMDVDVTASYMTGGMKPYIETGYTFDHQDMYLTLGAVFDADFTGIDNTVITLDYTNDTIMNSANADYPGDGDATESGRVTLDMTVSF